jgi:hypothetical protein
MQGQFANLVSGSTGTCPHSAQSPSRAAILHRFQELGNLTCDGSARSALAVRASTQLLVLGVSSNWSAARGLDIIRTMTI